MRKFITELQRRGVLKVAGLYAALVWFLLQVADVIFPAFGIPDKVIGIILIGAVVLFPLVVVLAWFFEITDKGIQTEEEVIATHSHRLLTGSEVYFVIIALLTVALGISIYMNFSNSSVKTESKEPVSFLVADTINMTGDSLFTGSIEQVITLGMEGADFISAYDRNQAVRIAKTFGEFDSLDEEKARLVALREEIDLVLTASIAKDDGEYVIGVRLLKPRDGTQISDIVETASAKTEVLSAINRISILAREALGDVSDDEMRREDTESLSSISLAAVGFYSSAQNHDRSGQVEEAIEYYKKSIQEDENFGRAYSGLALSYYKMGQQEESKLYWNKALSLINTMTRREKYRTQGLYYSSIAGNYQKAIETYENLIVEYPSDWTAHNNLAVVYFYNRQFERALNQGARPLDMFPRNSVYRANYSLYAMYASNFALSAKEAEKVLQDDPAYYKAYLPVAVRHMADNQSVQAIDAYRKMSAVGAPRATMLASLGMLDLVLYFADEDLARQLTEEHQFPGDIQIANYYEAIQRVYLAKSYLLMNQSEMARKLILTVVNDTDNLARLVSGALVLLALEDSDQVNGIIAKLSTQLQDEPRAYGDLLTGAMYLEQGEMVKALDSLKESVKRTDTWLAHYFLGRTYLQAGHAVEALSEFETCKERLGEAAALFLDDIPSFHYAREIDQYIARAKASIGMPENPSPGQDN